MIRNSTIEHNKFNLATSEFNLNVNNHAILGLAVLTKRQKIRNCAEKMPFLHLEMNF